MSHPLPTGADLVTWILREHRLQWRAACERAALPLPERVASGGTIAGLRVAGSEGGATRFRCTDNPSKLRIGDRVHLHPEDEDVDPEAFAQAVRGSASILERSDDGLELTVRGMFAKGTIWCAEALPVPWQPLGARPAVIAAGLDADHPIHDRWVRWLTGDVRSATAGRTPEPDLTPAQQTALHRALNDEVTVIQGPPGTGKSALLAVIATRLAAQGQRVLITAFSHAAIDGLLEKIRRRDPSVACHRIDSGGHAQPPEGVALHRSMPARVAPGIYGMTVFPAAQPWASVLLRAEADAEDEPGADLSDPAGLAAAFTARWRRAALPDPDHRFDVTIIDEASQMSMPQGLMALLNGRRAIVVGDHRQLPPVAQLPLPGAPSLFDQMIEAYGSRAVMLDTTFRMMPALCASPSRLFYEGRLRSAYPEGTPPATPAARRLAPRECPPWLAACLDPARPLWCVRVPDELGTDANPAEAAVVARIAVALLAQDPTLDPADMAVVCAHRRQNLLVKAAIADGITTLPTARRRQVQARLDQLDCETVERIQGQERSVILVSLTGADPDHLARQWTFSHCPRRFNVAITRAKFRVVVVGSPAFLRFVPSAGDGDDWPRLRGIAAIQRWYLDRIEAGEVVDATP